MLPRGALTLLVDAGDGIPAGAHELQLDPELIAQRRAVALVGIGLLRAARS